MSISSSNNLHRCTMACLYRQLELLFSLQTALPSTLVFLAQKNKTKTITSLTLAAKIERNGEVLTDRVKYISVDGFFPISLFFCLQLKKLRQFEQWVGTLGKEMSNGRCCFLDWKYMKMIFHPTLTLSISWRNPILLRNSPRPSKCKGKAPPWCLFWRIQSLR